MIYLNWPDRDIAGQFISLVVVVMFLRNCGITFKVLCVFPGRLFLFNSDVLKVAAVPYFFSLPRKFHMSTFSVIWFCISFCSLIKSIFLEYSGNIPWIFVYHLLLFRTFWAFMLNGRRARWKPRWSGQPPENQSQSIRYLCYDFYFLVREF